MIDVGNLVFFVASIPQMVTAYRNRKDLKGLSSMMLLGFVIASSCFAVGNASFGAYIASVLNNLCSCLFVVQLYWKWKYRND